MTDETKKRTAGHPHCSAAREARCDDLHHVILVARSALACLVAMLAIGASLGPGRCRPGPRRAFRRIGHPTMTSNIQSLISNIQPSRVSRVDPRCNSPPKR